VAAVAALLLSVEPGLTAAQARIRLTVNADPWGDVQTFGFGKLNAYHVVAPNPPVPTIHGPTMVQPPAVCSWTSTVSGGVPPYTYQWQGYASGTSSSIVAVVYGPGGMVLTVRDSRGVAGRAAIAVLQGPPGFPPGCF
jgi:hypothetical protein